MKLCTFTHDSITRFGIHTDSGVIDLAPHFSDRDISDLKGILDANLIDKCREISTSSQDLIALDDILYEPVIPNSGKILCVGINYQAHKIETGNPDYQYPMFFSRYPESQVGHQRAILKPRETEKLDYEGELAVIIGKAGRRISARDALSHIAGYACYNDGSVRDFQRHTTQFLPGKNFVGTGAFGPYMVTADEIPDPTKLHLQTRLNGEVTQASDTSLMINPIPQLIEYISQVVPLSVGDVLVTGTPGGVGCKRKPPVYLSAGDNIEVEISGIGILANIVEDD